jgi:tetratricopeptide (TPR) repeat protein
VGVRVRTLRHARGLTQAALAGDEFTTGYVSQVESGYSQISMRAAQAFAARMSVSVSEILGDVTVGSKRDEAALLEAEHELASGSPQTALKLARDLQSKGALRGRVLRLRGRALLAMDRSREALMPLSEAVVEFRRSAQPDLATRTLYDIALAHARLDESEEAILNALECERALTSGELVDRTLELEVRTLLASAYVRRGDFEAADLQSERALALAKDVTSREARAQLYAGVARSEQERGNLDRSLQLWEKSLRELESLGREHAVAETWYALANVHLDRDAIRRAREALSQASELALSLGHTRLDVWLDVTRARLALREGRAHDAQLAAQKVTQNVKAPARARAEAFLLLATAALENGLPMEKVTASFESSLNAAKGEPAGARARILRSYADALEKNGDLAGSVARLREALDLVRPHRT